MALETIHATLADSSGQLVQRHGVLEGHRETEMSQDGKWLAQAARGGLTLWKREPNSSTLGDKIVLDSVHAFNGVKFSPHGRFLLASFYAESEPDRASHKNLVFVWDLQQEDIKASQKTIPFERAVGIYFTHDGKYLLRRPMGSNACEFWALPLNETENPDYVVELGDDQTNRWNTAFDLAGTRMCVHSTAGGFQIWNLEELSSPKLDREFKHPGRNNQLSLSPNGQFLAGSFFSPQHDHHVAIWDLTNKEGVQEPKTIIPFSFGIRSLVFSEDSNTLICAPNKGTTQVWSMQPFENTGSLRANNSSVLATDLSSDGKFFAMGLGDGSVHLWDLKADQVGDASIVLRGHDSAPNWIRFSANGSQVYSGDSAGKLRCTVVDETTTLASHSRFLTTSRAVSSDDKRFIVVRSVRRQWMLWDTLTLTIGGQRINIPEGFNPVNISNNGRWALTSKSLADGYDYRLVDLKSGKAFEVYAAANRPVIHQSGWGLDRPILLPQGDKLVLIADEGKQFRVVDVTEEGLEPRTEWLTVPKAFWPSVSGDGRWLVAKSEDRKIRCWDLSQEHLEKPTRVFEAGGDNDFGNITVNYDGSWIACSDISKTVRLWDMKAEDLSVPTLVVEYGSWGAAFSPDGRFLALLSNKSSGNPYCAEGIAIWDLRAPDMAASRRVLTGPSDSYSNVTFSHDNQLVTTQSDQGDTYVWDVARPHSDESPLILRSADLTSQHHSYVTHVFSRDNKRLFGLGEGEIIQQWFLDHDLLMDRVTDFAGEQISPRQRRRYIGDLLDNN